MVECLRKGGFMDNMLVELIRELGNAINDSMKESDEIAEVVEKIKRRGYNIFIVLEATIGLNKIDDAENGSKNNVNNYDEPRGGEPHKIKFTTQDQRFMKDMKIKDPDK